MNKKRMRFSRKKRFTKNKKRRVPKAVKRYVKRAIAADVENKIFTFSFANTGLVTPGPATAPNVSNCLPTVLQGTSKNTRIGNQIKVKRGYIRGRINLNPYNAVTNPTTAPVLVKLFLVSNLKSNVFSASTASNYSDFFEQGSSSIGFQSTILDHLNPVNRESWIVHKTKTLYLGSTAFSTSNFTTGGGGWADNSKFSQSFYFNTGKYMKSKLKYDDNTSSNPNNKNLYLIYCPVYADGSGSVPQTLVECHGCVKIEYEDA